MVYQVSCCVEDFRIFEITFFSMKTIITGATGFVGRNLSGYLTQQHINVQSLSLRDSDWKDKMDRKADAIVHLAGKAHDTEHTSASELYFKTNRDLTIRVFNVFLQSEIKDFLFFSSVKAVADTVDGILTEDVKGNPQTPYGRSKHEAEQYLLGRKLPEGKRLFVLRPCMIHGPGNKGNLNLLYKIVEKGLPWPLAAFENKKTFLGIDNLNFAVLQMLKNPGLASGVYNLADDRPLSTNEVVSLMSKVLEKKARLAKFPAGAIKTVARMGDFLPLPLNSERLKKLTENYVVSNQKIKTALNIKQLPLTAEESFVKTIESFKNG